MKRKPFFPSSPSALGTWSYNYKTKIEEVAATLGITPAEALQEVDVCNKFIDAINAVEVEKNILKGLINDRNNIIKSGGVQLRKDIKRHKAAEGYTFGIGSTLGIIGEETEFNPDTYKPFITVESFGAMVQIKFFKNGVSGLNIYKRKKGEEFFKVVSRATKSPFKFQPSLDETGKPIHFEFIAVGVINDEQIGLASDAVSFVYSPQTAP
jgi:tRNA U34 2-thiouridine synthase MnmA/TrmU